MSSPSKASRFLPIGPYDGATNNVTNPPSALNPFATIDDLTGGDGNGIYDGSGTIPAATVASLTDDFTLSHATTDAVFNIDANDDAADTDAYLAFQSGGVNMATIGWDEGLEEFKMADAAFATTPWLRKKTSTVAYPNTNVVIGQVTFAGAERLKVRGQGSTGATRNTLIDNLAGTAKFIMDDDGQWGVHPGGTAATTVAAFGSWHQSTGFSTGHAFYGQTGTDTTMLVLQNSTNASPVVLDVQINGAATGTLIATRSLAWQTSGTTNIGVRGSARDGIDFNIGIDGESAGGLSQAPNQYSAAVRGDAKNNVDAKMYGGLFIAQMNEGALAYTKDIIAVEGGGFGSVGAVGSTANVIGGKFFTSGTTGTGSRIALLVPSTGNNGTVVVGADDVSANTSMVEVTGDVETIGSTVGLIVEDRTDGNRYRIYTDGGSVDVELA